MSTNNYLIGRGELLTEPLGRPPRRIEKDHPYTVEEARARLAPQLTAALESFTAAEVVAPNEAHVVRFVLHPAYIAKSYFPSRLLQHSALEVVGSRERVVHVEAHVGAKSVEDPYVSSEMFVAGTADAFLALRDRLIGSSMGPEFDEVRQIELIEPFKAFDKMRMGSSPSESPSTQESFEVVLHKPSSAIAPDNQFLFLETARELGLDVREDLAFEAGDLWFVPSRGTRDAVERLAGFTTVRVARAMPRLTVSPAERAEVTTGLRKVTLPTPPANHDNLRVAILDGGLPEGHALGPWVSSYREMNPAARSVLGFEQHGLAVASAFLFGPIGEDGALPAPPGKIAVIRVLDESTLAEDAFELYQTLAHVEDIVLSNAYDFINLSLGPDLPIEDGEVHAWTAVLDDLLKDAQTLMTVAVGNNGHLDRSSGNARLLVPGDAVNVLSVGASDQPGSIWGRATYSAVGPGRLPGRVKPDLLAFGGSAVSPFRVLNSASCTTAVDGTGTSLAAPLALRQAVSIRQLLGADLSTLAIRGLLIHAAQDGGLERDDVGWGKLPEDLGAVVVAPDGVAHIVYQGEVKPGKYIRATVPLPAGGLTGTVQLKATFCFASPVDAQSPDLYTRAALEPIFRPDINSYAKGAKTPKSRPFFSQSEYETEDGLRTQHGKWETVLRASDSMLGRTIARPVFDIHYNARDAGALSKSREPLKYALIITLEASKHVDLHTDILDSYPDVLVAIEPDVTIEVSAVSVPIGTES